MADPSTALGDFVTRHIGPRPADVDTMLAEVGASSLDDLVSQAVPASIRDDEGLSLPGPYDETSVLRRLRAMADRNEVFTSLIGTGYSDTITPPVILRNVLENPSWYTAYTPYQAEVSQGRLTALLNYQTMISDLTGLPVANASLLDEGTAAAEAMAMCGRIGDADRGVFLVDADAHPQTIEVLRTRAAPLGITVEVADPDDFEPERAFGMLLQVPGSKGAIRDHRELAARARGEGCVVVAAADILSLVLIEPPGAWGADIAVGSSQRFGVPLGFGGPHAAFVATRDEYVRTLPGRLVGVSTDGAGRMGLRLALQTREQHIRRERATSNVCTAQVLLAVISAFYAAWHGADGLRRIARRVNRLTGVLARSLTDGGVRVANDTFFDTLEVAVPGRAAEVVEAARRQSINLRHIDDDTVGISLDETTDESIVAQVVRAFGLEHVAEDAAAGIPEARLRTDDILTHPEFRRYHSEHEMLRYLRHLADEDLALDRTMIPLGSCTMKLNPTTAMLPITWEGFARLHPFAPAEQTAGYAELVEALEAALVEITGYDAVSLQPNAGSQGEFAGLLAIRAYHRSRGEDRDVCLIPSSAHGTNAASAAMAGMRVVVVACDEKGNVDVGDLRAKCEKHESRLAALMVTYPSTHGVFEAAIGEICDIVHAHGGQVYLDGANLNALVGIAKPGRFGADVSHLNLHKTFTIPHGGGGPGVGPIGVRSHLAPFLPNHPARPDAGPSTGIGPISAAPWGSAGILPISLVYLWLMGPAGLRRATEVAILNANYVASRLAPHFPVLFVGKNGRVAHECIVDVREIAKRTGVDAEDVSKRLADYGFHAPTLSFPVSGTLMIEPTESESLEELDRFCDAMISIREEISRVESGEWPSEDNPLVNAPHPAADVVDDGWDHPYTRAEAAFPLRALESKRYWPPVGRILGAAGDRNLVCTCPPPEAFEH
jgi:glycine dehydrogenase